MTNDTLNISIPMTAELGFWFDKIIRLLMVRDITKQTDEWVIDTLLKSTEQPPKEAWIFLASRINTYNPLWIDSHYDSWFGCETDNDYIYERVLDRCDAITSMLYRQHCELVSFDDVSVILRVLNPESTTLLNLYKESITEVFGAVMDLNVEVRLTFDG
jgi:hypothetical protein